MKEKVVTGRAPEKLPAVGSREQVENNAGLDATTATINLLRLFSRSGRRRQVQRDQQQVRQKRQDGQTVCVAWGNIGWPLVAKIRKPGLDSCGFRRESGPGR